MPDSLPSHVEWVLEHLGPELDAELVRQDAGLSARAALGIMCRADPSAKKLAVQWLAERFLDRGFLWEDVRAGADSKVRETLVAFGTYRRRLEGEARHLSSHTTLASAWKAVAPLMPRDDEAAVPGVRERRRREKAAAYAESIVLCERPGFTVAVPLTEAASRWWGRGTRWCTAADKDNAFDSYNVQAPLIVVVMPDTRLQLFVPPDAEIQFMDDADEGVSQEFVSRRWDVLEGLVRWTLNRNSRAISFVPEGLRDRGMCLEAVRQNGGALRYVPEGLCDGEMCLVAV